MPGGASNEERQRENQEEHSHKCWFSILSTSAWPLASPGWGCWLTVEQIKEFSITGPGYCPLVKKFQWLLGLGCWSRILLKRYYSSLAEKVLFTHDCGLVCYCSDPVFCFVNSCWSIPKYLGTLACALSVPPGSLGFKSWLRLLSDFRHIPMLPWVSFPHLLKKKKKKGFMQTTLLLWILNEMIYAKCLV